MLLHRPHLASLALALTVLAAGSAAAGPASATTRYAVPDGVDAKLDCTTVAARCSLAAALVATNDQDTLSLAAGTYSTADLTLPDRALHWVATDPAGPRPLLTTAPGTTNAILVPAAASGSSFTGLEIVNTGGRAMFVNDEADVAVSASVLRGSDSCIVQTVPALGNRAGTVTVEDSALSSGVSPCVDLPPTGIVRRSSIRRTGADNGIVPVVSTSGRIEDTWIDGGLRLIGDARAVRVDVRGTRAVWGRGTVLDSVARSTGPWPAVSSDSSGGGGLLTVVNVTAVSVQGPGLAARQSTVAKPGTTGPNRLDVHNAIARGTVDVLAAGTSCTADENCAGGRITIRSTNAITREVQALGAAIVDAGDNQTGDPRFVDPAAGDFHLAAGSPAIDAGLFVSDDPLDLDRHARVFGTTTDLGAYEWTPPAPGPPAAPAADAASSDTDTDAGPVPDVPDADQPSVPPPLDAVAPVLGRPRLTPARFRAGRRGRAPIATTLRVGVSEPSDVTAVLQQRSRHGWARRGRALIGELHAAGTLRLRFRAHALAAGTYRFRVTATDDAGNASAARTVALTVLPARR